jgi:type IV secretion system protein VirB10
MNLFKWRHQELDSDEENSIQGERDLSAVNKGISLQNKITNWAVMGGACLLAIVLLYRYYAKVYQEHKLLHAPSKDLTRTVATTNLPPLTLPDPEPTSLAVPATSSDKLPPLQPTGSPNPAVASTAAGQAQVKPLAELVRERRLKREVRFGLDGGLAGAATPGQFGATANAASPSLSAAAHVLPAVAASAGQRENNGDSRAYMLPDPTLMMTRGRVIPCTVIPAIDTTLTGIVTCVTAEDVTGADNKVSLMDRGTFCTGQQGGGVVQGQRRVGIIWQRCETPEHVFVPLDSGASDSLGRPGIPGVVDNHFWDRFGAAVALSLISDIGPYLIATRQRGNNNTTVSFPTITGPQEVMTEVLKSTASIRPTITASQGAQVLIYLAGDIDFRDVYQLERVK